MFDALRTRYAKHKQYLRTKAELEDLVFDLGIAPHDVPRIARETVYGR